MAPHAQGSVETEPPRLALALPGGGHSASEKAVRGLLAELDGDIDAVMIEQLAVLVIALTDEIEPTNGSRRPVELSLWTNPEGVRVALSDAEFGSDRSESGLLELDRSMISGWRLKLVERLADRWRISHDGELTVEFELLAPAAGRASDSAA